MSPTSNLPISPLPSLSAAPGPPVSPFGTNTIPCHSASARRRQLGDGMVEQVESSRVWPAHHQQRGQPTLHRHNGDNAQLSSAQLSSAESVSLLPRDGRGRRLPRAHRVPPTPSRLLPTIRSCSTLEEPDWWRRARSPCCEQSQSTASPRLIDGSSKRATTSVDPEGIDMAS